MDPIIIKLSNRDYTSLREQVDADLTLSAKQKKRLSELLDAAIDPAKDPQNGNRDDWNEKNVDVRTELANLRRSIRGRVWLLPNRRECVLDIPPRRGQPYRVIPQRSSGLNRIWQPHLQGPGDLNVVIFESLFFRYRNAVYIRSTNVNEDEGRDRLLKDIPVLKAVMPDLKPSMHYVSSGELYGAIALQNFFADKFDLRTRLHIQESRDAGTLTSRNEIVLAASRIGDPEVRRRDHEYFKAAEIGIEPGCVNDVRDPAHRIIHVLLSRRSDGALKTLLKGAHGRAIQGVCNYLTRDAADEVIDSMQLGEKRLPEQFQMVFQVSLTYDPRSKVSAPTSVKLTKWAIGKDVRSVGKASSAHS